MPQPQASNNNVSKNSDRTRLIAVMMGCVVVASGVIARAAYLQLIGDSRLEQLAKRQYTSKFLIRPRRGPIVDRNGEPLAISVETRSLAANPTKIKNRRILSGLISKATGLPQQAIFKKLGEKREFVWIKRHIPEQELNEFKKWQLIDGRGELVDGLWLVKESKRVFPHNELAAHILGDVNVDSEGLEGVELWQNERLRGKVVSVSAVKDAMGRPAFLDAVAAKGVQDGDPVTLTLDASLQFEVERELKDAVERTRARSGTVIVMNAVNGEILAMANEPSFNPNQKGFPPERRRNRAITDGYEPGSTLKAVLAAGALSNGWKISDQVWGELGEFRVQGKRISEAEAHEKFEWVSVKKMLQVSSNVAAAKIAMKLGAEKYSQTLRDFAIGVRTEIGFPGEIGGRIPARESWKPLTTANIGFGQGVLTTPLQMTRAYAAFLNGGWLVQPTLIKTNEKLPTGQKPVPPRRVIAPAVADQIVHALETVTQKGGTGTKAALEGYRVAGKTGTAQVVDAGTRGYSRSRYISSFIGFAVGVEPKIVVFTALDEPKGIYYASETAAPLFRQVLNAVANRFSLPTTQPVKLAAAGSGENGNSTEGAASGSRGKIAPKVADQIKISQASVQWQGLSPEGKLLWKMPALKGLTAREAMRLLRGRDFEVEVHGAGLVRSQLPEEGGSIGEGGVVKLVLSEP
jgi:cell division protein FtsI (penicillin-binding protein 3)